MRLFGRVLYLGLPLSIVTRGMHLDRGRVSRALSGSKVATGASGVTVPPRGTIVYIPERRQLLVTSASTAGRFS